MSKFLLVLFVSLVTGASSIAQVHPRLFFGPDEVATIRARASTPELAQTVAAIHWMTQQTGGVDNDPFSYEYHKQFGNYAILYLATGNATYASQARDETLYHISKTEWWANDGYKSLRRGALSRGAAISYDFCHAAWAGQTVSSTVIWRGETVNVPTEYVGLDLNTAVSRALKANAQSLIRSGGGGWPGNDKIGNNWFSVRYAGALLGILASDETGMDGDYTTALNHFKKYLETSLSTSPLARGWNPEGYGYAFYPSQYTFPALIALERLKNVNCESEIPAIRYALPVLYSGLMSIQTSPGSFLGIHPDFTDDNPQWFGEGAANLAFAFAPEEMMPALKWMYRRSFGDLGDNKWDAMSVGGLYALLYYPLDVTEQNPADVPAFGRNWDDPVSGFFSTRKAFSGPNDVLTQVHTKSRQNVGGHNGPDGSTFRVFALGLPWVVGSGRTTDGAGQTTIFPSDPIGGVGYQGVIGKVQNYYLRPGGGGFWVMRNQPFSDTGVRNWTRRLITDYTPGAGEAFFVVSDSSDTGRFWRLNTPAFNTITTSGNQFIVTNTETGHRMVATVLHPANPVFRTGDFVRGSNYNYKGVDWLKNNWIDFESPDGRFVVTLSIVPAGQSVPTPTLSGDAVNGTVNFEGRPYAFADSEVTVGGWERPVVAIASPADNASFIGGPQTVTLSGSASSPSGTAISKVEVFMDDTLIGQPTLQGTAWSLTTPVLARGLHTVRVRATDANLDWSEKSITVGINQTQPPSVTITAPGAGSSLPAGNAFVLRGRVSDPDGSTPTVKVFDRDTELGTARVIGGNWIYTVPGSAFPIGQHAFYATATDAAGDVAVSSSVTLKASSTFSAVPFYGDLANWTPYPNEGRVTMVPLDGDTRWFVEPSVAYTKRDAQMFVTGMSYDGDFRMTFRARLVAGTMQILFGNQVYMTFGAASKGAMRYTGWGDKGIGDWEQSLFPSTGTWHNIEISRIGQDITIKRDGVVFTNLHLNNDGTLTMTPDIVTEDLTFGFRDKYQWYKGFWSGGTIGIGAVFDDKSSFYMDDFNVEVLSGNQPPAISLTSPANGTVVASGAPVTISGTASDPENAPVSVAVMAGSTVIASNVPAVGGQWSISWTPPAETVYGITARARDEKNNTTMSAAATLIVGAGNASPTVRLTRPVSGAGVSVNANTELMAEAVDSDGAIVAVRFYVNNALVSTDDAAPYQFTWKPTSTGNYTIAAEAVDDLDGMTRSADVPVVVTAANTLPTTSLTAPNDLAAVNSGSAVSLAANASDSGGSIARVDFYANGELVATDASSPYSVSWTPSAPGTITLMSVATDNSGGTGYSTTRTIFVTSAGNTPPMVALTAPASGTALQAPISSIQLTATAADADGSVHRVEFFNGITKLGEDRTAPYAFTWANVQVGSYALTAKAVDNEGAVTASAASNITLTYTAGTESAVEPVADAYVVSNSSTNTGTATELRTQDKTRSYLRFPVTIPSDAVLKAARLRLYCTTGKTLQNLAFQSDDSWQETAILWANAPAVGPMIVSDFTSATNTALEFDVTDVAMSEATGDGKLSFTLGAASNAYQAAVYGSRENNVPASRPLLTLTYNRRPTASIQQPVSPKAGQSVTLRVDASDPDGSVASVLLSVNGVAIGATLESAPFQATWTPAAAGDYSVSALVTDNLGEAREVSIEVPVAAATDSFASWISGYNVGGLTAATADPDRDGMPNLLEYALGGDPSASSSALLPTLQVSGLSPQPSYLQLTFTPQRLTGLTYVAQAGSDLVTWSDTTLTGLTVGVPYTHTDGTVLGSGTPKRFIRLKITQP